MIRAETAVRTWIKVKKSKSKNWSGGVGWRSAAFGERVLVFDTETTTDFTQRLLFGFFRLYSSHELEVEGVIVAEDLNSTDLLAVRAFASEHTLELYTRQRFVDEIFFQEVYRIGTLCVGFNLPFDLSRIAIDVGYGRGKNRRKFRLQLSTHQWNPHLRIESASARAAFIGFAPKGEKRTEPWEKPFFSGRFVDLSTLVGAFTGERSTLRRACQIFETMDQKSNVDEFGIVTREALEYGRQDVLVTWQLYEKLLGEYLEHGFASLSNEREQPESALPITKIYSAASIAKQYLRLMGYLPLLAKQPNFSGKLLGSACASYFGGRAEVRVRRSDVPVTVLDFTSMYPTVFILQNLQRFLNAEKIVSRPAKGETQAILDAVKIEDLYDPAFWPNLARLVQVKPSGEILPVRMKLEPPHEPETETYSIAVTPFSSSAAYWYTFADVIASKLLGGRAPKIEDAIVFEGVGESATLQQALLRGEVLLDPATQIFKTVVEERQLAKQAKDRGDDPKAARRDLALKILANSGAYGIYAEVNVTPSPASRNVSGHAYSDVDFPCEDVHDERPGAYFQPLIASFVTGAARLVLGMLEYEVSRLGGTFAFCDTDSLAIVSGDNCPAGIPCLEKDQLTSIIDRFDALNPYDPHIVKKLLKIEYEQIPDLRCYAVSAKRYALYTVRNRQIKIVKASESGLGAIIGRTEKERLKKLARRIWASILYSELKIRLPKSQKRRLQRLHDFDIPMRRKLPVSQPNILARGGFRNFNKKLDYSRQIKPFGFLQAISPAVVFHEKIQPIAPFENDATKSRRLKWYDFESGHPISIDWEGSGNAGTIAVLRLSEYIDQYARHPESKAADNNANPAGPETRGLLGRLHLFADAPVHIGKEVDRLDEDEGTSLDSDAPIVYSVAAQSIDMARVLELVERMPREEAAAVLKISVRWLQNVLIGAPISDRLRLALIRLAGDQAGRQHSDQCLASNAWD